MTRVAIQRLARDERGLSAVEFAFVAPILFLLIMGLSELTYRVYVQSVLTGAVQQAGRNSAIEASDTDTIDDGVEAQVLRVASRATFAPSRLNYDNFQAVAPEPFTDTNGNSKYDVGECYKDINGNSQWDAEPGATGQGGADAVTLYRMQVTYPHLFPIPLLGLGTTWVISSQTILKNQPYQTQATTTVVQRCS